MCKEQVATSLAGDAPPDEKQAAALELLERALDRRFADRLAASAIHEIGNIASRYGIGCITAGAAAFLIEERLRYLKVLIGNPLALLEAEQVLFAELERQDHDDDDTDPPPRDLDPARREGPAVVAVPGTECANSNSNSNSNPEIEDPEETTRIPNSNSKACVNSVFGRATVSSFGIRDFLSGLRASISIFELRCRRYLAECGVRL